MKERLVVCLAAAIFLSLSLSLTDSAYAWCDNPRILTCGSVVDSNNASGHTDVDRYNCTGETRFRGKAHVYKIHHPGGPLWITLGWSGDPEMGVFVLGSCDRNDCIAYDPNYIYLDAPEGFYWIIVDGRVNVTNSYRLSVFCGDDPLAVELTSFDAVNSGNRVHLRWVVASEHANDRFEIERKITGQENWLMVGSVRSQGDAATATTYGYDDINLPGDATYAYRLSAVDVEGARTMLGEATINFSHSDEELAGEFRLIGNYPNPFNPSTTIRFEVAETVPVSVGIYDMSGRLVGEAASGIYAAGMHDVSFSAGHLPSGLYFARIIAGSQSDVMKMILMK